MRSKRARFKEKRLRPNQYLELVVFDPDQGKMNLFSRVLEVNQKNLVIIWPVESHGTRYFFKNVDYAVVQCLVEGEALSFKVHIRQEDLENHEEGKLALGVPVFVEEVDQQRIYTRVRCQVPVKYRVDRGSGFSDTLAEGLTLDLSIGGMELASFEELEEGSEIECFFTLHFMDFRGVQGKIVRRRETTENGNLEYLYAIQFLGMLERERTSLNQILMLRHPMTEPKILLSRTTNS